MKIFLITAICLLLTANETLAQCGADGTQPCKTTSKQKNTVTKKTPKKNRKMTSLTTYNGITVTKAEKKAIPYYQKGLQLIDEKKFDEAIREFTKAIATDPKFHWAYIVRGDVYKEKGDLDAAIKDYDKAIQLWSNNFDLYQRRASVYFLKKDYVNAVNDYTKAIKLDSKFANLYFARAEVYEAMNRKDLASADREKGEKLSNQ